eukprot:TRINITY_DN336_c0_g1_i1.p1 TRINITY_DN336_c0_g1~~TRINITY_DN336_c0_g1_i1.p1  ORF type:complete len:290 (-),score=76.69 TRINITY_DN336_c0_g1_i1:153-1022(-)
MFATVDPEILSDSELNYDYMKAYLDFYTNDPEGPKHASDIAAKYRNMSVLKKRKLFSDIEQHLSELRYKPEELDNPEVKDIHRDIGDRERKMLDLATQSSSFDVGIQKNQVKIDYRNLDKIKVNFYLMDIELLFSTSPFIKEISSTFSFVSPNHSVEIDLPKEETSYLLVIPDKFKTSNVYIEILGEGVTQTRTHYSNNLNIQIIEKFGHLKALHSETGRPISQAYVKVYSKQNDGSVKFYKDGYTDLRGRFDYVSLSTDQLKITQKFSILISSEEFGAVVKDAVPPKT